jgi:signal transduction histidine kinase
MYDDGVSNGARRVLVFTVLAVTTTIPVLLLLHYSRWSGEIYRASELMAYAVVLGAATFVYLHWRMTSSTPDRETAARLTGWLTVGLAVAGFYGLVQSSLLEAATAGPRDSWPQVGQIVMLVVLIVLTQVAERVDVPGDPALAGAAGGLLLTAVACLTVTFAPPFVVSPTTQQLLSTVVMVTGLILAWTVLQRNQVSMWARRRLAISAVLLTAAYCVGYLDVRSHIVVAVAVFANLLGAVVLCAMTQSLLRRSVLEHQRELQRLQEMLAKVRADVLEERELLHEVGSTVAGITTASRVMRHAPTMTSQHRARLEHMLDAELARLDRLMSARAPAAAREFDVDDVVEQLVTSHQARGLDVDWTPGHVRAVGDPDDLAEVVNILLENARRHGAGSAWVEVSHADGHVEVACTDNGPGVSDEIRPQLFTSGARGPDSPGQGLGLSIAKRLMSERGGSLVLADSHTGGATFVARLPVSEIAHAAAHHVA